MKYIIGLESYGPKSACFEHGERWVQKLHHKKGEELIETQRDWGAGCYEVPYYCDYNRIRCSCIFTPVQMY